MFARTERLLLRPAWAEDAPALFGAIADEGIVRNLASAPWPYLPEHAEAFVMRERDPTRPASLIFLRTDGAPQLVGAIGSSGDGNDQSDMIAFLGLHNAGIRLGGAIRNADPAIRADRVQVPLGNGQTSNLRYIRCPFAPFVGTNEQNVCQGT